MRDRIDGATGSGPVLKKFPSPKTLALRPAILQGNACRTLQSVKGAVAQWLEQGTHNPLVVGSNPTGPTFYSSFGSYVARDGCHGLC